MIKDKEVALNIVRWCQSYRYEDDIGKIDVFLNTIMGSNDHEFFLAISEITKYGFSINSCLHKRVDMFNRLKKYCKDIGFKGNPYFRQKPPETRWYRKIARTLWGNEYERII